MEPRSGEPPRSRPTLGTENPCHTRQPGLGLLAELATEDDFQPPLEKLLDAICTLSGALHGVVRFPQGRSGKSYILAQSGGLTALSDEAMAEACAQCGSRGSEGETQPTPRCQLSLPSGGTIPVHVILTPLHSRRDEICGSLVLIFPEGTSPPTGADALQRALGKVLGMALETSWRAEQNSERMQSQLCAALTQERQLLANEVHDSLAQNLASMRMRTTLLRDAFQRDDRGRGSKYLTEIEDSLAVAHGRVRELITQFRTAMAPGGLVAALRSEIGSLDGLGGVELSFDNRLPHLQLSAEQEMQVLHIVREALANIVKHAQAHHGRVTLGRRGDRYEILVEDDGVGLGGSGEGGDSDYGHYGLNIMRERASHLGGDVLIASRAGQGTKVLLHFPAISRNNEART